MVMCVPVLVHRFGNISIIKYISSSINILMPRISCRPKLSFTQEELDYLTKLCHSRNQAASIVTRSKIVLFSYWGKNDTEISRELKIDYKTVRLWIQRVLDLGVKEGLVKKSRSGKPRVISACLLYTSDAADDLLCVDLG